MVLSKKRRAKVFKFLKIKKLPYLPYVLWIEPGNICNLSCPLCPTGKGDKELPKGFMKLGLFKDVFNQLSRVLTEVFLFNWGEPLLNNDLCDMIRYVKFKSKKIRVIISTNLNISQKERLTDLVKSGVDEIIVSCDGASQGTYAQYRVGGSFNLVVENMRYLVNEKLRLATNTCVVWNFIVFKHNEHEIEQAREMAVSIGVDFRISMMRTSPKDEILKPHSEAIKQDIAWIPDNSQYSAYDKHKFKTKKQLQSCRRLWQEICINWDGKVFPCCGVYEERYNFGDASKQSIKKIWNNSFFVRARKEVLNVKYPAGTICGICRNNGYMHM